MMFSFGNSLDDLAKIKMEQAMDKNVSSKPGRQRPRNPQKKQTLERWQKERGGTKIGTI
ncbi:hypothetical protein [Vagococcus carniphilus]|uniref:hypothetical protein n=1 Tax=Vagococcus carniphilus TaxID=218144 RepID=UPI00163BE77E|nr:hypothetical protein [Vagococcus carniphilus]QNN71914.1 hypothetical protein H9L18_08410 [Vagococcus carniphilus]